MLFWTVVFIGFALAKNPVDVSTAFVGVLRSLHPKLLLLFASATLYCVLVLYAAKEAGLWHTASFKATLYWFVGTGVVLVGDAVTATSSSNGALLRRVLARVVAVTILVEFLVALDTFPFLVEVVLVFLATALIGLQLVARHDASTHPLLIKLIESGLVVIGLVYLANFAVQGISDPDALFTTQRGEELLVGPALTVLLMPFLYAAAWISRREQAHLREQWQE